MSKQTCAGRKCVLLGAIIILLSGVGATAQRKAGDLTIRPYVFENGKGEKVDAELGVLLVPENRRDPQSNLIELAFVRFKSTAKNPGAPVVYLAGGPGGSGSGTATGSRFPLFMAMREVGDVIAFDQRGTGRSKPNLTCFQRFDFPPDVVPSREAMVKVYREQSKGCAGYWRELQRVDLSGYNTNESADDLEDLRKALGAKQISLWAISYGTHLALATIRRHPQSIHRAILAGTEGPDHTYKLPGNIQKHLADLAQAIKADPELGKEIPDFLGLMKSVLDKLEKEPAIVEVTDPLTKQPIKITVNKFALQYLTASNIGTTDTSFFPAIYYAASKGDYSLIAKSWLNQTRNNFGSAMSFMMDCASGQTAARAERISREAKGTLLEDAANQVFPDVCSSWDAPDLGDEFRSPVKADTPVLFISGTLDARTPVSNAEEYAAGFPKSTQLIIDGVVHSDPLFLSSPKIKDVMLEFMKGSPISTNRITPPPMKFAPIKPQAGVTGTQ
jgi:pimeloyl-ACP methyl ester carboxylesterase